jgi:type VI secretion system protein ImpC
VTENNEAAASQRVQFQYEVGEPGETQVVEAAFLVTVVADLSGAPTEPRLRLSDRRMIRVDADNIEDRLRSMRPQLNVQIRNRLSEEAGDISVSLCFQDFSDFEPIGLARQCEPLRRLLEIRDLFADLRAILTPESEEVLVELLADRSRQARLRAEKPATNEDTRGDLEALLGAARLIRGALDPDMAQKRARAFLDAAFSGELPFSESVSSAITAHVTALDQAISTQLEELVHHPEVQRLEASWRGLKYLVDATETDRVRVQVLDATKKELSRDFRNASDIDRSSLFRLLAVEGRNDYLSTPVGLIVVDDYFSASPDDVGLLESLARVSAALRAPLLSAAGPSFFGMESFSEISRPYDMGRIVETSEYAKWRSFRRSQESAYVCLALPRILLREPYRTSDLEAHDFQFVEAPRNSASDRYLWGNAAWAIARRIVASFERYGWCSDISGLERGGKIGDLPRTQVAGEGKVEGELTCLEVAFHRRPRELAGLGFTVLSKVERTGEAVIGDVVSCHKLAEYDDQKRNEHERAYIRLESVLCDAQVVRYVQCVVRDKVHAAATLDEAGAMLRAALERYVVSWGTEAKEGVATAAKPISTALCEVGRTSWDATKLLIRLQFRASFRRPSPVPLTAVNLVVQ